MSADPRKPLWLIPNLLSLDAPLVAVAWLHIFAKTWRVDYLPWVAYASLGLVVWLIYAVDRLLDISMLGPGEILHPRHEFHRRHQRKFKMLAIGAGVLTLVLVITGLPMTIYGHAFVGAVMVSGFFALSLFSSQEPHEIPYAKNIVAGLAFAYGTAMIAMSYTGLEMMVLLMSGELICFMVLCILNISAIDLWENAYDSNDLEIRASNELALTLPLTLLGGASLLFALRDPEISTRPFFHAILTGAALLYVLNRNRARFTMDALRVLADVALLIPFIVFMALTSA